MAETSVYYLFGVCYHADIICIFLINVEVCICDGAIDILYEEIAHILNKTSMCLGLICEFAIMYHMYGLLSFVYLFLNFQVYLPGRMPMPWP